MPELINQLISTLLQIILFTLIPFLFFLFGKDKQGTFLQYIGLYRTSMRSIVYAGSIALLFFIGGIGLAIYDQGIKQALLLPNTVTGKLHAIGLNETTVVMLLLIAWFKTALAEEVLFRGFIAKRLMNKLGFIPGNTSQAIIFGAVHLLLFWSLTKATMLPLVFISIFSTAAGWSIGFIKEKYAAGSIIPGWIAHGLGNTLAYFVIAFLI